ncbi:MAG: hypothetical protein EOM73_17455, partial [Bacteroidia bacterium]|nr:hypothetical protein [Bacteroidia bacterium]
MECSTGSGFFAGLEFLIPFLQFAGGENGRRIESALQEEGLEAVTIPVEAETRCCTTCLNRCNGKMTELIEPSLPLSPEASETFL